MWFVAHVSAEPRRPEGDWRGQTSGFTFSLSQQWFSQNICHLKRLVSALHLIIEAVLLLLHALWHSFGLFMSIAAATCFRKYHIATTFMVLSKFVAPPLLVKIICVTSLNQLHMNYVIKKKSKGSLLTTALPCIENAVLILMHYAP